MRTGVDPMVDCVFKKLFGSNENKHLLLDMLNAVLEAGGESKVVDLKILNPYNLQNWAQDKFSIVDIKAQNQDGEWFIVEVQVQVPWYFPKRLLYYWARIYQSQLKKSERYNLLKKATVIAFTKEPLPILTEHYQNHFRLLEVNTGISLCDDLSIHTIELAKFKFPSETLHDDLSKWTYFLKHGENLHLQNIPDSLQNPSIQHAVKELSMFTQDDIQREIYESRRKAAMDESSARFDAFDRGLQEGEKKGKLEGLQEGLRKAAANALRRGTSIDDVQEITGLSLDMIQKIQSELESGEHK